MRKLQSTDVFNTLRMIKKAGIKEEVKPMLLKVAESKMNVKDAGIEAILTLIEILSEKKSEQAIYEVLAGPFEMEAQAIAKMDLEVLIDNLERLGSENDLKRFFTLLAKMIGK